MDSLLKSDTLAHQREGPAREGAAALLRPPGPFHRGTPWALQPRGVNKANSTPPGAGLAACSESCPLGAQLLLLLSSSLLRRVPTGAPARATAAAASSKSPPTWEGLLRSPPEHTPWPPTEGASLRLWDHMSFIVLGELYSPRQGSACPCPSGARCR